MPKYGTAPTTRPEMGNNPEPMKTILAGLIALLICVCPSWADVTEGPLTIKVKRLNGIGEPCLATNLQAGVDNPNSPLFLSGASSAAYISNGCSLQFFNGSTPVEVTGFTFTTATYSIQKLRDGTWVQNGAGHGAWGSDETDGSRPNTIAFNVVGGTVTPSNTIATVVGTIVPTVHRFVMSDHRIPLGNPTQPLMTKLKDGYRIVRVWRVTFTYGGIQYPDVNPLAGADTSVIWVASDRPVTGGVSVIGGLQKGDDLTGWTNVPLENPVPNPAPADYDGMRALAPSNIPARGAPGIPRMFIRYRGVPATLPSSAT